MHRWGHLNLTEIRDRISMFRYMRGTSSSRTISAWLAYTLVRIHCVANELPDATFIFEAEAVGRTNSRSSGVRLWWWRMDVMYVSELLQLYRRIPLSSV